MATTLRSLFCVLLLVMMSACTPQPPVGGGVDDPQTPTEEDKDAPDEETDEPIENPDKDKPNEDTEEPAPPPFEFEGDAAAHLTGAWSEVVDWNVMAIHAALLPDGNVLTYGTDASGVGPAFNYDIWDPSKGLAAGHTLLDVTTETDIFCTAQAIVPGTTQMLLAGGTTEIRGNEEDGSSADINFLNLNDYALSKSPRQMLAGRFYPTITTLANGEMLVHGGRSEPNVPVLTPEVYTPGKGWRELNDADDEAAYQVWYYPWSFVAPNGRVFFTGDRFGMWWLDTEGKGKVTPAGNRPDNQWRASGSAVMYDEGKILLAGGQSQQVSTATALTIDINQTQVKVEEAAPMMFPRSEHDLTLLPNGDVLASGGSAIRNTLEGVAYTPEIWNPASDTWTAMKDEGTHRLYHSSTMLLPDGRIFSGGGGRPGPDPQINAQLFYPPYLFKKDGSGELAARPQIKSVAQPEYSETFELELRNNTQAERVTLVRFGSVTHAWNMEQRFNELDFSQDGKTLTIEAPEKPELAPPGYYLLFVLDAEGVPSVGEAVNFNVP